MSSTVVDISHHLLVQIGRETAYTVRHNVRSKIVDIL